jgi:hexosaminidase
VGWEEIQEGGLPENAVMMAWKNQGSLGILAASQGHDVVVCPTAYCYLNIYQTRGTGSDPKDYRTDGAEPLAFRGYIPLEKVYSFEPVFPGLDPEASDHIIGSQANLWTEFISNTAVLEYMLFPRLCALAEVVWTGKEKRDYQNFRNRLDSEFLRLTKYGVNFCDHPD